MNTTHLSINAPHTVAVFPGQGSQIVGMGKDLFQNFAVAREVFEEASEAIRIDLKKLCFEGPKDDLTLTENTQPCLLTASVAAYRVVEKEFGFVPGAAAGHSLGEYSALVAIGSIGLAQATRWVRARGKAMQEAVPPGTGSMAAILGLDDEAIESLCKSATALAIEEDTYKDGVERIEVVEPANFNAPGQVVIAGSAHGVKTAISLVQTDPQWKGGKAILLQVSAPFHCRLMRPARDQMASLFAGTPAPERPKTPRIPYVPNRTARLNAEGGVIFELLVDQVDHPVLWRQSVSGLLKANFTQFVEFGPGKVLSGLIKRIAEQPPVLHSVADSEGVKGIQELLRSAKNHLSSAHQESSHV